jgi:acetylornithine deacetylase/succinyl-diaminopimelate desuccinylase-like protein
MPGIADNALVKASRLITRLGEFSPEPRLIPETEAFLAAITDPVPSAEDALAAARAVDPLAAEMVEPLLSLTVSPTMIEASTKRNVIPGRCEVTVDCRLLPGQTEEEAGAVLREWLGEDSYELEWRGGQGGTRSPLATPLWSAVQGFTDSHWLREAFGTVAYGFFPMRTMSPELAARLIHSADERIPVDDVGLGVDFLRAVAQSVGS